MIDNICSYFTIFNLFKKEFNQIYLLNRQINSFDIQFINKIYNFFNEFIINKRALIFIIVYKFVYSFKKMARKFTNSQPNNKKHNGGGSYNNSSQKNNKISKQTKKDNKPSQPVLSKPQQQSNISAQKISAPVVPPPPSKPLT